MSALDYMGKYFFVRAELALKLKPLVAEKAKEKQGARTDIWENSTESVSIDTREQLAAQAGVSSNTISKTENIIKIATPDVVEMARSGEIPINAASTIAAIPLEEQEDVIAEINSGEKPANV